MKGYHKSTEPHRESGKIYCDANNILLRHSPPHLLIKNDHILFSTLGVVDVVSFFSVFLIKLMMRVYKTVSLLQQIDENVHSQLREKNADRLQQLQHGYVERVFVCLFSGSVPLC